MHNGQVAIGGDGQATMGNYVAKSNVRKIRKLYEGKVLAGFAGSTADAFTLIERFEEKQQDPTEHTPPVEDLKREVFVKEVESEKSTVDRPQSTAGKS